MRICIPDMELLETLRFAKDICERIPGNDEVVFDFSKMNRFDPLSMLILGTTIRNYRDLFSDKTFYMDGTDGKSFADTLGFFQYLSEASGMGAVLGEVHGSSNYIPITQVRVNELRQAEIAKGNYMVLGDLIEKEAGRLARVVDQGNDEFHKLLTYLIREMLRNTPEHAGTNTMWICGKYCASDESVEIAAADEGIGIYKSLTGNASHREYITDNEKALKWAVKAGISKAFKPSMKQRSHDEWANSGFGLYMINEICKYLNGSFGIISYDNYMLTNNREITYGETKFCGTAVRMKIYLEKISDAQKIISKTAAQGEMEARTIRNAFKNASAPSKGLMTE